MSDRTIQVKYLARVEGEGALTMRYRDGEIADVELHIFEPPRFFEAFLVGRSALEAPDITARICGICPVAYQMSACKAVEDALDITVHPRVAALRRLLYCGEWIESHVLHMVMLHAPDFLGVHDAMTMARSHGTQVAAGLAIKKAGNLIVSTLGGREIHPINVRVGGFYSMPRPEHLSALRDELIAVRPKAEALLRWMAGFTFPALSRDYEFVALRSADRYPMNHGRIVSTAGLDIDAAQWADHFIEEHVQRSNALHARIRGRGAYLTGPLARFNLNFDVLPDNLKALSEELGILPPVTNPFRMLLVRGIEVLLALDEAIAILSDPAPLPAPSVEVKLKAGVGYGATEAPRGMLYHRYEVSEDGLIVASNIVPPTSQNQLSIEADLRQLAPDLLKLDEEGARWQAEQAIRNHDPCISCATHFLRFAREVE